MKFKTRQNSKQLDMRENAMEMKSGVYGSTLVSNLKCEDLSDIRKSMNFLLQQGKNARKTVILSDPAGKPKPQLFEEIANILQQNIIERFIGIGLGFCENREQFKYQNQAFYKNVSKFLENEDLLSFEEHFILVAGSSKSNFQKLDYVFQEKTHETILNISLDNLIHNLNVYRSVLKPNVKLMVMVKAAAYGSGITQIGNLLQANDVDYLGVAYPDEGINLRLAGVELPIMVLSPEQSGYEAMIRFNLEPEIYNLRGFRAFTEKLKKSASEFENPYPIHIKVDTGMNRLGFEEHQIDELIEQLLSEPSVRVTSVMSHLAVSEDPNENDFTLGQIEKFERVAKKLEKELGYSFQKHILNSSGISRFPDAQFDMVRLGLGIYGVTGDKELQPKLKHISSLRSEIVQIREIEAGETVGYGRAEKASKKMHIATVSIGYADGLDRRLGNRKANMLINNQPAPIIGNVCMDMCMLDITDLTDVKEGDEVIVFGQNQTVQQLAKIMGTIPYEVLTSVSGRVKRVYLQE
jgi:alanine racemase